MAASCSSQAVAGQADRGQVSCSISGELVTLDYGPNASYETIESANEACSRLTAPNEADRGTTTTVAPAEPAPEASPLFSNLAAADFGRIYDESASSVVELIVNDCVGVGTGTAFAISPTDLLTANHVVRGQQSVTVELADGRQLPASVIGTDQWRDLALVRVSEDVFDPLTLAEQSPLPGHPAAAVGFPKGRSKSITTGSITAVGSRFDGVDLDHSVVQFDAAVATGNSGGPILDRNGEVLAVVIAGDPDIEQLAYATDTTDLHSVIQGWSDLGEVQPSLGCTADQSSRLAEQVVDWVAIETDHPEIASVALMYYQWSAGISNNAGDTAYLMLSQRLRSSMDSDWWIDQHLSTVHQSLTVHSVTTLSGNRLSARISFRSTQDGGYGPRAGEWCSDWLLDHTLEWQNGSWRIDGSKRVAGWPQSCGNESWQSADVTTQDFDLECANAYAQVGLAQADLDRWYAAEQEKLQGNLTATTGNISSGFRRQAHGMLATERGQAQQVIDDFRTDIAAVCG